MAKKQTRRSISVSAERYAQIEKYCTEHSLAKSAFIERIVEAFFAGTALTAPPTNKGNVKFL